MTPTGPRRLHARRVLPDQADTGGHQARPLEEVAERAHGARAVGSDRGQEHRIYFVLLQEAGHLGGALFVHLWQ